jgi:hypothetical protein
VSVVAHQPETLWDLVQPENTPALVVVRRFHVHHPGHEPPHEHRVPVLGQSSGEHLPLWCRGVETLKLQGNLARYAAVRDKLCPRPKLRCFFVSTRGTRLLDVFTERLLAQGQASPRTVAAYRDTPRMLLVFVALVRVIVTSGFRAGCTTVS